MTRPTDAVLLDLRARQRLVAERLGADPLPRSDDEARTRLRAELEQLDLGAHVVDLELDGYTVLPPGRAAPTEFTERLRDAILRVADEREAAGVRENEALQRIVKGGAGRPLFHLVREDPVFEQAVANPVALALVTYLAGYRAKLTTSTGLVKSNEYDADFHWHTDVSRILPEPWPQQSVSANVNWLLTDYSRENGALCVVPGSHNWCHRPDPGFSFDDERVRVIEEPAGSLVIWHSNLWHGALARTAPGKRVTFVTLYLREMMAPGDAYMFTTTPEMLERNPARFGVLMGLGSGALSAEEGPDPALGSGMANPGRWT